MPCNEIRTTTVALERADRDLLTKALQSDKWQVLADGDLLRFMRYDLATGTVSGQYDGHSLILRTQSGLSAKAEAEVINSIKRAYSAQVVAAATARFGWRLQSTDNRRFVVQRRG